jgi:hypothetical protein
MASQVTVFVENKPGRISRIARKLGNEGINIRAVTVSDMGDYGLINIIADDPDRAESVLSADGFSVSRKYVIAIIMEDRPGGLADISEYLHGNGINISNAYGFILERKERAVLILEVDDYARSEALIRKGGFHTLSMEELHNL